MLFRSPCLYMLGSSSQPKCFACVNLSYTRCMRMLESITPDHHVVLRNNELSQWCTVRGNTSLNFFNDTATTEIYTLSLHDALPILSTIRLMFDLSVFRVPRPCLYMLGSSSQPKCFACVDLAYTRCMRTLESITPIITWCFKTTNLRNGAQLGGTHLLKF